MKNIKNFTISIFAVIGFVVIACSAAATAESIDDNPVDNPPVVQSNIGKYQVALGSSTQMTATNTETGVMKTYYRSPNDNSIDFQWIEHTSAAITFTH
jgi:hypothetical protein